MKVSILALAAALLLTGSIAQAQEVAMARAAELGCHRIERLRDLGRIDEEYVTNFYALSIVPDSSNGATFKWTGRQAPGGDGSSHQIELMMNSEGKTIGNHTEIRGTASVSLPWPDKDPVTLMETALHFVLENGPSDAAISPFFNNFSDGVIDQIQHNGSSVARVVFRNSANGNSLEVLQQFDGTLISTQVK